MISGHSVDGDFPLVGERVELVGFEQEGLAGFDADDADLGGVGGVVSFGSLAEVVTVSGALSGE